MQELKLALHVSKLFSSKSFSDDFWGCCVCLCCLGDRVCLLYNHMPCVPLYCVSFDVVMVVSGCGPANFNPGYCLRRKVIRRICFVKEDVPAKFVAFMLVLFPMLDLVLDCVEGWGLPEIGV